MNDYGLMEQLRLRALRREATPLELVLRVVMAIPDTEEGVRDRERWGSVVAAGLAGYFQVGGAPEDLGRDLAMLGAEEYREMMRPVGSGGTLWGLNMQDSGQEHKRRFC